MQVSPQQWRRRFLRDCRPVALAYNVPPPSLEPWRYASTSARPTSLGAASARRLQPSQGNGEASPRGLQRRRGQGPPQHWR